MIGEKIIFKGETLFRPGSYDDGLSFGEIFKDEDAFHNNPDEVCYIPEAAFTDDYTEHVNVNGEEFFRADGYTRRNLEDLIGDNVDEEGNRIDIDAFFGGLTWACPETYLLEITY